MFYFTYFIYKVIHICTYSLLLFISNRISNFNFLSFVIYYKIQLLHYIYKQNTSDNRGVFYAMLLEWLLIIYRYNYNINYCQTYIIIINYRLLQYELLCSNYLQYDYITLDNLVSPGDFDYHLTR